jgi:hypothetical protein
VSDEIDFENEAGKLRGPGVGGLNNDPQIVPAIGLLVKALIHLDKTSSRLAKIYIWLTVILGIIGIVQIVLRFRAHN